MNAESFWSNLAKTREAEVEELRDELRSLRREMKRHRQPVEALNEIEKQVEALEEQVVKPIERRELDVKTVEGPIRLGSKVRLRTLGTEGVVTALSEDEAEVQVGVLRVRTRLTELDLKGQSQQEPTTTQHPSSAEKQPHHALNLQESNSIYAASVPMMPWMPWIAIWNALTWPDYPGCALSMVRELANCAMWSANLSASIPMSNPMKGVNVEKAAMGSQLQS